MRRLIFECDAQVVKVTKVSVNDVRVQAASDAELVSYRCWAEAAPKEGDTVKLKIEVTRKD